MPLCARLLGVWLGCCLASAAGAATERPHVLLLVADDLGWNDVEFPEVAEDLQARLAAWPMAEPDPLPLFEILFDPDTFGGEEGGRPPWPDAVLER